MGFSWLVGLGSIQMGPRARQCRAGGKDVRARHRIGAAQIIKGAEGAKTVYRGTSAKRIWSRRSTVLLPRTTFGGLDLGRRA